LIASLGAALLISIIPVRVVTMEKRGSGWKRVVVFAASVAGITLIPLGLTDDPGRTGGQFLVTGAVVAAHVIMMSAAFVAFRRFKPAARSLVIGAGVLCLWAGPLVVELIAALMRSGVEDDPKLGLIGTLSPMGLLVTTWTSGMPSPGPGLGLVVQFAVAGLVVVMAVRSGAGKGEQEALSASAGRVVV
jgi:hypothetical protein